MSRAAPSRQASAGGLAHGARDEAEERTRPAGLTEGLPAHRGLGEQRGAAEGVRCAEIGGNPGGVAAHGRRIGEKEECARDQGGIQEVHPRAAEDLLAEDDPEGHSQRHHPERDGGGEGQRQEHSGDQKALVDLVSADDGGGGLDDSARRERDDEDRQVVEARRGSHTRWGSWWPGRSRWPASEPCASCPAVRPPLRWRAGPGSRCCRWRTAGTGRGRSPR